LLARIPGWQRFLERQRSPRGRAARRLPRRVWITFVATPLLGPWLVMAFMRYAQVRPAACGAADLRFARVHGGCACVRMRHRSARVLGGALERGPGNRVDALSETRTTGHGAGLQISLSCGRALAARRAAPERGAEITRVGALSRGTSGQSSCSVSDTPHPRARLVARRQLVGAFRAARLRLGDAIGCGRASRVYPWWRGFLDRGGFRDRRFRDERGLRHRSLRSGRALGDRRFDERRGLRR